MKTSENARHKSDSEKRKKKQSCNLLFDVVNFIVTHSLWCRQCLWAYGKQLGKLVLPEKNNAEVGKMEK
jgi:hypothetical protein